MRPFPPWLREHIVDLFYHRKLNAFEEGSSLDHRLRTLNETLVNEEVKTFWALPAGALENFPLNVRQGNYQEEVKAYLETHFGRGNPGFVSYRYEGYTDRSMPRRGTLYFLAVCRKSALDASEPYEGLFLKFKTKMPKPETRK